MSETYSVFSGRVRNLLKDVDPSAYVVPEETLIEMTANQMQLIGNDVNPGTHWLASPISIVPGTEDYALSTSLQYTQVIEVRRGSDKYPLLKRTVSELSQAWIGAATPRGPQVFEYALWEDDASQVNIRVRPVPSAADTLEIFLSDLPPAITSASTAIPFSGPLLAAMAKQVAGECIMAMTQDQLDRLHLTSGLGQLYLSQANEAKDVEDVRIRRLKRLARIQKVDT